jgi:hypothetical protein
MAHTWVNVTFISDEDYQSWLSEQKSKQIASVAVPAAR